MKLTVCLINSYQDKLEMLAEGIKEDERNTKTRDKAHRQV